MVHAVANVSSLQVAEVIVDAGRMNMTGQSGQVFERTVQARQKLEISQWQNGGVKPKKLRGKLKVDLKSDG